MRASSTVRSRSSRLTAKRGGRWFVLGIAALAPLSSMAVVAPSAVAVSRAKSDRAEVFARLDERNVLTRKLGDYCDGDSLQAVESLSIALETLIPTGLRPLDEFGEVRSVAAARGIELRSIRLARTHSTGAGGSDPSADPMGSSAASGSRAVVIDEVVVTMIEPLGPSLGLIDDLRAHGMPTVVLGFDVNRSSPAVCTFHTELRLGFLRRAASARTRAANGRAPSSP